MIFKYRNHETKQVSPEEIPQRYQHLLIPHATQYYVEGLFGSIISQEIREEDFTVWQHHFFIEQPCTLMACNKTPVVAINYMLEGSPFVNLPGKHEPLLEEGTYRLFFVPIKEQNVSLIENNYTCVHLNYLPVLLKTAAKKNTRLHNLIGYVTHKEDRVLPYLSGEINEHINTQLLDILWYNGKDRSKYVNRLAYRLMLQYVLKHHAVKGDMYELEKYIEYRLGDSLTIDDLIKFSCKSERMFFREFKAQFNTSPKKYIQHRRVEKAKRYLRETVMTITEISMLVGFDSPQSFHKTFKKHTKMTPEEYRASYRI